MPTTKTSLSDDVFSKGLIPIAEAAQILGIPEKRLIGFIFRNGVADPIGDHASVYGWSLKTLAERLASTSSVSLP